MEKYNAEYDRYRRAQKRVNEIKGFYGHLTSFVIVNLFFIYLNLKYSPEYLWFFWPTFGWGIGLFFHGVRVFQWFPFLSKEWEQKKIKQFMEEESNKNQ